jgi:hypothetical protein
MSLPVGWGRVLWLIVWEDFDRTPLLGFKNKLMEFGLEKY